MSRAPTLAEDLSYIRDLAEAGQNAPLLGGRFLVMWGGLVTLAYTGHFLIATDAFGLGPAAFPMLWATFIVVGIAGQFLLMARTRRKPGLSSAGNRVQGVLWTTEGFFLFAFFAGLIARIAITGEGVEGFAWSVPLVLGLYGIGQFVTGVIAGQSALKFAGIAAFSGVVFAVFLTGSDYLWLVGAAAAFVSVFLPGLMMMRDEPDETV